MHEYLITVWDNETGKSWCYRMGCTDPDAVRADLKKQYDRFVMHLLGD